MRARRRVGARQWKSSRAKPTFQSVACVATGTYRCHRSPPSQCSHGAHTDLSRRGDGINPDDAVMPWEERTRESRVHTWPSQVDRGGGGARVPRDRPLPLPPLARGRDDVSTTERRATSSLVADRRSSRVNPNSAREIPARPPATSISDLSRPRSSRASRESPNSPTKRFRQTRRDTRRSPDRTAKLQFTALVKLVRETGISPRWSHGPPEIGI